MPGRRGAIAEAPAPSSDDHRVVPFRPRRAKADGTPRWRAPMAPIHECDPDALLLERLARYEREGLDDDYRHRMMINGLAFAVTLALIATGVWLADIIGGA